VAVLPGDVLVGDGEGVVVIPRAVADSVIRAAYEQEQREVFILSKIEAGSSILGVYPPDEQTLREFEAWKASRGASAADANVGESALWRCLTWHPMFVRFAAQVTVTAPRAFTVAYCLYEDGDLAAYERTHLEQCIGWFEANLKIPNVRACPRTSNLLVQGSAQSPRHRLRDEHQVAAEPWTDLRRRLN
jgi:hypothetical protein